MEPMRLISQDSFEKLTRKVSLLQEGGGIFFCVYISLNERDEWLEVLESFLSHDEEITMERFSLKQMADYKIKVEKILRELPNDHILSIYDVDEDALEFSKYINTKRKLFGEKLVIIWLTESDYGIFQQYSIDFMEWARNNVQTFQLDGQIEVDIEKVKEHIANFEEKYGISSEEFIKAWEFGEYKDHADYAYWALLYFTLAGRR